MLHFELVTPDRVVFKTDVDQVTLPTTMGEITVLPHHAPLVATLVPGVARLVVGKNDEDVAVSGGFIQIGADGTVRVIADTAERGHELDLSVIEEAKQRAEKVMRETTHVNDESYAMAAAALERELARFRVAHRAHASKRMPPLDATRIASDENPA